MRRKRTAPLLAAALLLAVCPAAFAQATVPGAPWVHSAEKAFTPAVPGLAVRPSVLLETNYYVYAPGTPFTTPELTVTLDSQGYGQPATMYLYWENRENGQRQYYNVAQGGFSATQRDLFSRGNTPVRIFVPSFDEFRLFGPNSAFGPLPAGIPTSTGLYQFVLEIRDANGQQVIARGNAMYSHVNSIVQVSGNVTSNTTWTNDNAYYLATPVYVTEGNTLTIEPGTVIFGSKAGQGTLVIRTGARINAEGDADRPIILTSELEVGQRAPGDWGGLVINGRAPVNVGPTEGEGNSGTFGGNDPNDDSGVLRYVRVEFAGIRFSEQNELNGIALQGVGRGTEIDHIQIHWNQDDGIEFFGGTAQAKYVLVTNAEDDSLDWTFGWDGKLQFFVAVQNGQEGDNGIEADNFDTNPNLTPRSNPTIYNATFVGNRRLQGASGGNGWLLRHGTAGTLRNAIVTRFAEIGVEVDGTVSQGLLGGALTLGSTILFDNQTQTNVQEYLDGADRISFADPRLPNENGLIPDLAPLSGSPARDGSLVADPPNDGFFDNVNYIGGVSPNAPWIWEGWTTFSDN